MLLLLALAGGFLYLAATRGGGAPEDWLTDLDRAKRQAATSGKRIFVTFSADWCPPCRVMKHDVFPDAKVKEALSQFVAVHIDVDAQPRPAEQFAVSALPTLFVLDAGGAVLARFEGGLSVDELLRFLRTAPGSP